MYLVNTNVWLERILYQAQSEEAGRFFDHVPSDRFSITDFALHSIGVVLTRLTRTDTFLWLIQDAFVDGGVTLIRLDPEDLRSVVSAREEFELDFDDAYQYVAAEKHGLILVSLDADFDRT